MVAWSLDCRGYSNGRPLLRLRLLRRDSVIHFLLTILVSAAIVTVVGIATVALAARLRLIPRLVLPPSWRRQALAKELRRKSDKAIKFYYVYGGQTGARHFSQASESAPTSIYPMQAIVTSHESGLIVLSSFGDEQGLRRIRQCRSHEHETRIEAGVSGGQLMASVR